MEELHHLFLLWVENPVFLTIHAPFPELNGGQDLLQLNPEIGLFPNLAAMSFQQYATPEPHTFPEFSIFI
jgi:hypothetical protein